jgi:succinyl-CoA synthetase alpha subunit
MRTTGGMDTKQILALIVAKQTPSSNTEVIKRMGHAGAIVSATSGRADSKIAALNAAGAPVADTTADIPRLVKKALGL